MPSPHQHECPCCRQPEQGELIPIPRLDRVVNLFREAKSATKHFPASSYAFVPLCRKEWDERLRQLATAAPTPPGIAIIEDDPPTRAISRDCQAKSSRSSSRESGAGTDNPSGTDEMPAGMETRSQTRARESAAAAVAAQQNYTITRTKRPRRIGASSKPIAHRRRRAGEQHEGREEPRSRTSLHALPKPHARSEEPMTSVPATPTETTADGRCGTVEGRPVGPLHQTETTSCQQDSGAGPPEPHDVSIEKERHAPTLSGGDSSIAEGFSDSGASVDCEIIADSDVSDGDREHGISGTAFGPSRSPIAATTPFPPPTNAPPPTATPSSASPPHCASTTRLTSGGGGGIVSSPSSAHPLPPPLGPLPPPLSLQAGMPPQCRRRFTPLESKVYNLLSTAALRALCREVGLLTKGNRNVCAAVVGTPGVHALCDSGRIGLDQASPRVGFDFQQSAE